MGSTLIQNTKKVVSSPPALIAGVFAMVLVGAIGRFFFDLELTIGNMGHMTAYTEVGIYILFTLLFGLFVAVTTYKINYFQTIDGRSAGFGSVGGLFGLLVAGCPACSITLASYLGLASFLTVLPFGGMELKIVGIAILLYVVWQGLIHLETCERTSTTPLLIISHHQRIVGTTIIVGAVIVAWSLVNYAQDHELFWLGDETQHVIANETNDCQGWLGGCNCDTLNDQQEKIWC